MSFFSSIKATGEGLKDFFLPSSEVAAQRRLDVFGTESKGVAAAAIVGSAAALLIAPPLIAAEGGYSAVAGSAASALGRTSVGTKLALGVAVPVAAGVILNDPKTVSRTAGGIANFESNLYQLGKNPSLQNAQTIFKENPIIATAATGAALLAVGGVGAAASAINTAVTKGNTNAVNRANDIALSAGSMPSSSPSVGSGLPIPINSEATGNPEPTDTPLTAETQVIGKEVKTGGVRRARRMRPRSRESNSIKILNQNTYIQGY
jgi:hypothetical protein